MKICLRVGKRLNQMDKRGGRTGKEEMRGRRDEGKKEKKTFKKKLKI